MLFSLMRGGIGIFLLLVLCCQQIGCRPREYEWQSLLPEGKAHLVAVLKPGITHAEIDRFQEEELIVGDLDKGHWHRRGIDGTMQQLVDGYETFALVLDPSSTPEEREAIRERLKSSPYVYRVFENVAPEDINLDEATAPEGETARDEKEVSPG